MYKLFNLNGDTKYIEYDIYNLLAFEYDDVLQAEYTIFDNVRYYK